MAFVALRCRCVSLSVGVGGAWCFSVCGVRGVGVHGVVCVFGGVHELCVYVFLLVVLMVLMV